MPALALFPILGPVMRIKDLTSPFTAVDIPFGFRPILPDTDGSNPLVIMHSYFGPPHDFDGVPIGGKFSLVDAKGHSRVSTQTQNRPMPMIDESQRRTFIWKRSTIGYRYLYGGRKLGAAVMGSQAIRRGDGCSA